jgi:16S rRNA (guanine527-N7)-methyltransferase
VPRDADDRRYGTGDRPNGTDGPPLDPDGGVARAERLPLPSSPADLPALGEIFETALDRGLSGLGLRDGPAGDPVARAGYEVHARLLLAWNRAINLTAVRDPAGVALRHVCDSLSALPLLAGRLPPGGGLLDLGSGGGYPGLPLAAALRPGRVSLLDSVAKKARFLSVASDAVRERLTGSGEPVPHIDAVRERAEDLAEDPDERGAWDAVTARAVGSLSEVVELGLPLLRPGGLLVAWKREDGQGGLHGELRAAGRLIHLAGGGRPEVVPVPGPDLTDHRLVVIRKERPSAANLPRPPSLRHRPAR